MQWPDSWEQITESEQQALEAELRREAAPGHLLYAASVQDVARRVDNDDVLFGLNGSSSVAVVHLSYGRAGALWPQTQTFSSLEAWKEQQGP